MSSIAVQGGATGTGVVTLLAPVTNTNRTINLPDSNGTIVTSATAGVPINGPAFSAYSNAAQTVSNNTLTKVVLQVEDFDTNSCFDSTTNYRFTPTVAGYYQVNGTLRLSGTITTVQTLLYLYKNGSAYADFTNTNPSTALSSNGYTIVGGSVLVYMNGSTDYLEIYGYYFGGTSTFSGTSSSDTSRFQAAMVRSAV